MFTDKCGTIPNAGTTGATSSPSPSGHSSAYLADDTFVYTCNTGYEYVVGGNGKDSVTFKCDAGQKKFVTTETGDTTYITSADTLACTSKCLIWKSHVAKER